MFTSEVHVCADYSRLLQASNSTTRQSRRAPHQVVQAATSEGLAQGSYVVARVGFKPATLRMQGTELTTEPPRPPEHQEWSSDALSNMLETNPLQEATAHQSRNPADDSLRQKEPLYRPTWHI